MRAINIIICGVMLITVVLDFCNITTAKTIYVDDDAIGLNNGSSWENAYTFLQDALADANSAEKPVDIRVAQGAYRPDLGAKQTVGDRMATFQLINGVTITGGYAGATDSNTRDIELYQTFLSGDLDGNDIDVNEPDDMLDEPTIAENSYHVVTGSGTDNTAILDGFTITAGKADGPTLDGSNPERIALLCGAGMYNVSGNPILNCCTFSRNRAWDCGGMYNYESNPILNGCTFSKNLSYFSGGGIYNDQSNPILNDCTFSENLANFYGGGIFSQKSYLILNNCTINGNQVLMHSNIGCDGGGLYSDESDLILTNCIFKENYAAVGGGISSMIGDSNMNLTNCMFIENIGFFHGGGISSHGDNLNLTNCTFIGNVVHRYGYGGGIYGGILNLTNCIIRGNFAMDGAGIYKRGSDPNLSNCIFVGNYAYRNGGGIFIENSDPTLINCTFAENRAVNGSTIACGENGGYEISESNAEFINCIVWDSNDAIWIDDDSVVNASYSNIKGGWEGQGNMDVDPLFAQRGYWVNINDPNIIVDPDDPIAVWSDGDYHLKSQTGRWDPASRSWVQDNVTSPCIDAGDPNSLIGDEPIPNGGLINMGAYGGTAEASMSPGQSLSAYWMLDETEGNIAYDSAGNNDAVVYNAQWAEGLINGALDCNGLNTYMDCGTSETLGTKQMTISLWLEPQHMGGMRYIISRANLEEIDYTLMRHYYGEIELAIGQADTEPVSVISSATTPLNQWTHLAVTLNGSLASIYINGQLDSCATYATRVPSDGYNLTIASHQGDTRYYNGKLDEIRIYNIALSQEQIEELAQ